MAPPKRVKTWQDAQKLHAQHPCSSSSSPPICLMRGVVEKARSYHSAIPTQAKVEIQDAEEDAFVSHNRVTDDEVRVDFVELIPDPGNTRGRATLYQKTLDMIWSHKLVLGKALTDCNEAQVEILMQLDKLMDMQKQSLFNQQQLAQRLGIMLAKDPST